MMKASCTKVGSLTRTSPFESPPLDCFYGAAALGGDTINLAADGTSCSFMQCGSSDSLTLESTASRSWEVYSRLVAPWVQLTRAADGYESTCEEVRPFTVSTSSTASAVDQCASKAISVGSDTFDLSSDRSSCLLRLCGDEDSVGFTTADVGAATYSVLGSSFEQLTLAKDGYSSSCTDVGVVALEGTSAASSEDSAILACSSQTTILGGDTFDLRSDLTACFVKSCLEISEMDFVATAEGNMTFTKLGGRWKQVTQADSGVGISCTYMGSYTLSSDETFSTCYSQGFIKGADSFDWKESYRKCYFKRCVAAPSLILSPSNGGFDSFTFLTNAWAQVSWNETGVATDCTYMGNVTVSDLSHFPAVCYSEAMVATADTVDWDPLSQTCVFRRCKSVSLLDFAPSSIGYSTFTSLAAFVSSDEWIPCDTDECVDVNFYFTAALLGMFVPVLSTGAACDPLDAADCFGGHPRRLSYYNKVKEELEANNEGVVLLDLGGAGFGGPFYDHPDYAVGTPAAIMQNLMPYDACLFGQSDFLTTTSVETARQDTADSWALRDCPILMANANFNEPFKALNDKIKPYIVKSLPGGGVIGIVGYFPREDNVGYTYTNNVMNLDPNSRLAKIEEGDPDVDVLRLNLTSLLEAFEETNRNSGSMSDYFSDVFQLASETIVDLLAAADEVRRTYSDELKGLVAITSTNNRLDQLYNLARNSPFDVILYSPAKYMTKEIEVHNVFLNRTTLIAAARPIYGLGLAKLRFTPGKGLTRHEVSGEVVLDSTVDEDEDAQAILSDLYENTRQRNKDTFGRITNPLVGGHRGAQPDDSKYQCYTTDCSAGDVIGKAFLWKARNNGHRTDFSLYNLGGLRSPLFGDDEGVVSLTHCIDTLKFQNVLKVYDILGKDFYAGIKSLILEYERGFMGAGFRVAMHEPCWDYVNHSSYAYMNSGPPGSVDERLSCTNAGIDVIDVVIIDVEVERFDESVCGADAITCDTTYWEPLELGSTYRLVSTDYLAGTLTGYMDLDLPLTTDALALCDYIADKGVLEVDDWKAYRDRGAVQYATAEEGWATGNRIPSVVTSVSRTDNAALCPDGKFLPTLATACIECEVGTHSTSSSTSCTSCEIGFFGNETGLSACHRCPAGRYSDTEGSTDCKVCDPGTYSESGSITCFSCREGFYNPQAGASVCSACVAGTYTNVSRATECTSCGGGFITQTITSKSFEDCVCPAGSFRNAARDCETCPEGLSCLVASDILNIETGDGPYPVPETGYMTRVQEPLKAWRCLDQEKCPGGKIGFCEANRDSAAIACGLCMEDTYESGDKCNVCADGSGAAFFVAIACGVIVVATTAYLASSDVHKRSRASSFFSIAVGVQLTAIQTLSVFRTLTLTWVEPLNTILRTTELVTFNLGIVRTACLFGSDPVFEFASRQLTPILCVPVIVVVLFWRHRQDRELNLARETCNAVGTVFSAFYIGLLKSCLAPFVCYQHPEDHGASMVEYPSVLCWDSDAFVYMAVVSVIGFLCVPMPFTVAALYGTVKYKSYLSQGSSRSIANLHIFRFMWFRFSHERYYYGLILLLRNFLLSIVPIFATYDPVVQIGCMTLLLLGFATIQSYMRPWRVGDANIFDTWTTNVIVSLLVVGAMASDLQEYTESLKYIAIIGMVAFAVLVYGVVIYLGIVFCGKHRFAYDYFLCHHKAHAGAQARLLKVLLQSKGARQVFIDSDNLHDLDTLFDTVKFKVRVLLVYLTSSVLTRPWCAGEIFSACKCKVTMVTVRTPDFVEPSLQMLENIEQMLDESACKLADYKISYDDITKAYHQLLGLGVRSVQLETKTNGVHRFRRLASAIVAEKESVVAGSASLPSPWLVKQLGLVVISVDAEDNEAVAAADILSTYLMLLVQHESEREICRLCDYEEDLETQQWLVLKSCALVVILSKNTLQTRSQVEAMAHGMARKAAGGATSGEVVPVNTPGFHFPSNEVLDKGEFPLACEEDREHLKQVFKQICVLFPTHASEEVLRVQSSEVWNRMAGAVKRWRMPQASSTSGTNLGSAVSSFPKPGGGSKGGQAALTVFELPDVEVPNELFEEEMLRQNFREMQLSAASDPPPSQEALDAAFAAGAAAAAAAAAASSASLAPWVLGDGSNMEKPSCQPAAKSSFKEYFQAANRDAEPEIECKKSARSASRSEHLLASDPGSVHTTYTTTTSEFPPDEDHPGYHKTMRSI